jgi:hypothetical protein
MEVAKLKIHGGKRDLIVDKEYEYLLSDQYYWRAIQRIRYGRAYEVIQGYKKGGEMCGSSHKLFYIHRIIMDATKDKMVDHINHDIYDNRKCNLRLCNNAENIMNSFKKHRSKTGYKGVSKSYNKKYLYRARMGSELIGYFNDIVLAAKAYDKRAFELFGEFAYLNFPELINKC